jgi:hypothetical protein
MKDHGLCRTAPTHNLLGSSGTKFRVAHASRIFFLCSVPRFNHARCGNTLEFPITGLDHPAPSSNHISQRYATGFGLLADAGVLFASMWR